MSIHNGSHKVVVTARVTTQTRVKVKSNERWKVIFPYVCRHTAVMSSRLGGYRPSVWHEIPAWLHCTYSQVLSIVECSKNVCQRYLNLPWGGHEYVCQVPCLCWDVLLKTLNTILSWHHGRLLKFQSLSLPFFSYFIRLDLSFPLFLFVFLFVVFYVLTLDFPLFLSPYLTFQLSLLFFFIWKLQSSKRHAWMLSSSVCVIFLFFCMGYDTVCVWPVIHLFHRDPHVTLARGPAVPSVLTKLGEYCRVSHTHMHTQTPLTLQCDTRAQKVCPGWTANTHTHAHKGELPDFGS